MKYFALLALLVSVSASAQSNPPTVDTMTCAQAQRYAVKNKHYWKKAAGNDIVPIYPIVPLQKLQCPTRQYAAPIAEETLDNPECVLTWYCKPSV